MAFGVCSSILAGSLLVGKLQKHEPVEKDLSHL